MRPMLGCFLVSTGLASSLLAQSPDWPAYGSDRGGERFSPLTGIDRGNVKRLQGRGNLQ
ncbi:MAG TPA: hypothetical protein VGQ73_01050 [Gemmatimonadales bacterium]|nr:hypothetical protein [Gemmatimonadales bacterium]